jgi:hypothetical protein
MGVMASSEPVPAPLIALGREVVEAIASTGDMTSFRGAALLNPSRDSIIQALPSYETAPSARYHSSPSGMGQETWPVTG